MLKGQNSNRPSKGQCITAEPIRNRDAINAIRKLLKNRPRDLCLFEMGIHTNLRIGDLLSLTINKVIHLKPGDTIPIRQQKRGKFGLRTLNNGAYEALRSWLAAHPNIKDQNSPLFPGNRQKTAISREYASRMVKNWCKSVGLSGNYSAHTLRKTFGYHAVNTFKAPVHVVSAAFGHTDIKTTLLYIGIQDREVADLFMNEL